MVLDSALSRLLSGHSAGSLVELGSTVLGYSVLVLAHRVRTIRDVFDTTLRSCSPLDGTPVAFLLSVNSLLSVSTELLDSGAVSDYSVLSKKAGCRDKNYSVR